MNFSNIKIYLDINNNISDQLDINLKNLEKGDTLNYLINNIENYLSEFNKNNISFDKNNITIHKLKDINNKCLWSNDLMRNNKCYDDLEIEDNSIYCLKFKNINNISLPKNIKSGYNSNIDKIKDFKNINNKYLLNDHNSENNICNLLMINDNYQLFFKYIKNEEKYIIEKSINIVPKLSFKSNIVIKKIGNQLEKYGYGKITFSDGLIYNGVFIFNNLHNFNFTHGIAIYPDGRIMKGDFIKMNNKIYLLKGKINYPNGIIMEGEFDKIYLYFDKYILLNGIKILSKDYREEGIFNDNKLLNGKITTSKYIYEGKFSRKNKLLEGKISDLNNNLIEEVIDKIKNNKRKFTEIFDSDDNTENDLLNNK